MSDNMDVTELDNFNQDKIKHFIKRGIEAEKSGNSGKAIENYINARDFINETTEENVKFDIYIRLGDIYQLIGNLDDGLSQFHNAYNISLKIGDKSFQVDSLLRIANSYLFKNEANHGVKYTEAADNILLELNYTKGKLESGLFWARYYYLKQDNFKAREVCIGALKLCGEDYPIDKGKILNIFAELSSYLVSNEEYLALLNQAYECFKKANYERGMLGILNNIGHVYDNKMQDYEKSLEYFLLLKEKSEDSIFVEFGLFASVNIGEIYFKLLKYEEAIRWLKEAEDKPVGTYPDNAKLYIFILMSHTYLKLCNYEEAYKYFMMASKEVVSKNVKGSTLNRYYNLAAVLYDELGKGEEAAIYGNKAIEAATNEQSLLKWETGTIYELIKLREAKNKTDVLGVLEGIRHLITKFKNTNTKLDIIFNFSLQLIDKGYKELAFKLLEEYKHNSSDLEIINLKRSYLELVNESKGVNKLATLENLLKLSTKLKDYKMTIRIYCSLGDYYLRGKMLEAAFTSYQSACENINELMSNVPEEFKSGVLNSSHFHEIFNKLGEVNQLKD